MEDILMKHFRLFLGPVAALVPLVLSSCSIGVEWFGEGAAYPALPENYPVDFYVPGAKERKFWNGGGLVMKQTYQARDPKMIPEGAKKIGEMYIGTLFGADAEKSEALAKEARKHGANGVLLTSKDGAGSGVDWHFDALRYPSGN